MGKKTEGESVSYQSALPGFSLIVLDGKELEVRSEDGTHVDKKNPRKPVSRATLDKLSKVPKAKAPAKTSWSDGRD